MRISISARVGAVLLATAALAAACSSSSPPATTTTTKPVDTATAQADIGAAYNTLFNFSVNSTTEKLAVVQDGAQVKTALTQALASPLAKGSGGARVDNSLILYGEGCSSQKLPSPCAKVTYDILGTSGTPSLAGQTGYAVYSNGSWLVAKATICGLLDLFYQASGKSGSPPGC